MAEKNQGSPYGRSGGWSLNEPVGGWGVYSTDLYVKRSSTAFEYRRRVAASTPKELLAAVVAYLLDEKIDRTQLGETLVISYESAAYEVWDVQDVWKNVVKEQRLRAIARASLKRQTPVSEPNTQTAGFDELFTMLTPNVKTAT